MKVVLLPYDLKKFGLSFFLLTLQKYEANVTRLLQND